MTINLDGYSESQITEFREARTDLIVAAYEAEGNILSPESLGEIPTPMGITALYSLIEGGYFTSRRSDIELSDTGKSWAVGILAINPRYAYRPALDRTAHTVE